MNNETIHIKRATISQVAPQFFYQIQTQYQRYKAITKPEIDKIEQIKANEIQNELEYNTQIANMLYPYVHDQIHKIALKKSIKRYYSSTI